MNACITDKTAVWCWCSASCNICVIQNVIGFLIDRPSKQPIDRTLLLIYSVWEVRMDTEIKKCPRCPFSTMTTLKISSASIFYYFVTCHWIKLLWIFVFLSDPMKVFSVFSLFFLSDFTSLYKVHRNVAYLVFHFISMQVWSHLLCFMYLKQSGTPVNL